LVDYIVEHHRISLYRACRLLQLSRSVKAYNSRKKPDTVIAQSLRELAEQHKRYGFRKLFQLLKRRGIAVNHKRAYRIYCDLKLNLKCKPKKRLPVRVPLKLEQPVAANITWSLDYMSDSLSTGQKFRTVNVIDDFNREAIGIMANTALPAHRVTGYLDIIAAGRGYPKMLRFDNGPENISQTMHKWARKNAVELKYIEPGKPAQNGYIERFNRTYREEVLDMYLFKDVAEVQSITDSWLVEYNTLRPHHSLGYLTPHEWAAQKSTSKLY